MSAAAEAPSDQGTAAANLLTNPSSASASSESTTSSAQSGSSTQGTKSSEKPANAGSDGSDGSTAQWLAQSLIPALSIPPAATQGDAGAPADADGKTVSDSDADALRSAARDSIAQMLWSQTVGVPPSGASSTPSLPQAAGPGSNGSTAGDASTGGGSTGGGGAGSGNTGSAPQSTLQLLTLLTGAAAANTTDQTTGSTQSDTSSSAGRMPPGASATTPDLQSVAAAAATLTAPMPALASAPFMSSELKSPVGTAPWVDELGNHLTWMAQQGVGSASLHLSPADLGPIEAHISTRGAEATVWFGAAHPDTRAALEQALPRLRAMFANQGMALADSGVFREAPRQSQRAPTVPGVSSLPARAESPAVPTGTTRLGLLDLYA